MVWPFSKNEPPAGFPQKLPFKSGSAFIEYQCKFGFTEIKVKQGIVALVVDSRDYGTKEAIKVEADGRQIVTLKVASSDGGFIVSAQTPTGKGDRLKPDDIVIWVHCNTLGTSYLMVLTSGSVGWGSSWRRLRLRSTCQT